MFHRFTFSSTASVVNGVPRIRPEHAVVEVSLHVWRENNGPSRGKGLSDDASINVFAHEDLLKKPSKNKDGEIGAMPQKAIMTYHDSFDVSFMNCHLSHQLVIKCNKHKMISKTLRTYCPKFPKDFLFFALIISPTSFNSLPPSWKTSVIPTAPFYGFTLA